MITLQITDEQLQTSFQKSLDDILKPGNYSNPVKKVLEELFGYSSMKDSNNIVAKQIKEFLQTSLETPRFQQQLGEAIAKEMAKRAVDALEKNK